MIGAALGYAGELLGHIVVVHGACPTGADLIADRWARSHGVLVEAHPAMWGKHGRDAGPIRNGLMVDLGAAVCLGFPAGASRGTRDCMRRAVAAGIPTVDASEYGDLNALLRAIGEALEGSC